MKTIGLLGGVSWPSTLEYYRLINQETNRRLGGVEAARCVLYSFNFGDITRLKEGDPDQRAVGELLCQTAPRLVAAGAECLVLCANTLHMFASDVRKAAGVPLIHIADATATAIRERGLSTVGLLGTRPTMEKTFYLSKLRKQGIQALVPAEEERGFVHDAIMTELVRGIYREEVRARFLEIMRGLAKRGAEGIVLGCTEIPLIIKPQDSDLPLFDTTAIHALAAVDHALAS